jgi:hypothetical protein
MAGGYNRMEGSIKKCSFHQETSLKSDIWKAQDTVGNVRKQNMVLWTGLGLVPCVAVSVDVPHHIRTLH